MSPNLSPSSFIPKRDAARQKRRKPAKRIFIFSLIAYSLVFASLLASGAVYLYKNYTTSLLENEVSLLNAQINTFSVSDLSVLSEFDISLQRAIDRFSHSASVVTALDAIDQATAEPVQILDLTMERSGDGHMLLQVKVSALSFDSALFQRKLINTNSRLFNEVTVKDVSIATAIGDDTQSTNIALLDQPVTFQVTMQIPIESLPANTTQSIEQSSSALNNNQTVL